MDIRLSTHCEGYEKFIPMIENSRLQIKYPSARQILIRTKQVEIDGVMTDVCEVTAIGLMPYFPDWTYQSITFCEDGTIVYPNRVHYSMDGAPCSYGGDGWHKSNDTI